MNMKNFILKHLDFKIYAIYLPCIISLILIVPMSIFLPQKFGYENGLLENIQMFILFACFFASIKVKKDNKFFIFIALLTVIFILREINCGRTLFFAVPGTENTFYAWRDIKYGYLAHPIFGIFILSVFVYFIKNKLYKVLWKYLCEFKIPVYNILMSGLGIVLSEYADKYGKNLVFEEMSEIFLYFCLFAFIYLYGYDKNFLKSNNAQI